MLRSRITAALIISAAVLAGAARAQPPEPAVAEAKQLVVGTKEAPPFAMKGADGNWSGLSIDLWRKIADETHLNYRFVETPDVQSLIDGVANGQFDLAVAAVTVTAARERTVDFSEPFYLTGLGIAVGAGGLASWLPVIRTLTSFGFAQAVAALIGLAAMVGLLIWLFERRHNEHFSGGVAKGLSTGIWWSTVAMTQRHTGELGPLTMPGRIVAIVWMIGSIVAIAIFTAGITSVMTVKHLQGAVHDVGDLSSVRVGAVGGTSTEDTLTRLRIKYRTFATPEAGLKALRAKAIDAFVYDRPLLAWIIRQHYSSSIELVDTTFDSQEYAFVFPNGGALRKSLNISLLEAVHSNWWQQTTFRYLGAP